MFTQQSDIRKCGHVVPIFTQQSDIWKAGHVVPMFTQQSDIRKRGHVVPTFKRQSDVRECGYTGGFSVRVGSKCLWRNHGSVGWEWKWKTTSSKPRADVDARALSGITRHLVSVALASNANKRQWHSSFTLHSQYRQDPAPHHLQAWIQIKVKYSRHFIRLYFILLVGLLRLCFLEAQNPPFDIYSKDSLYTRPQTQILMHFLLP